MFSIHNFFRGINKNLRNIIIAVVIVAFVIGIIQLLNYIAKEQKQSGINIQIEKDTYSEQKNAYSVLTDEKVNEEVANKNVDLINEFVSFCNQGKVEEAYALISDECKDIYYTGIEDFREYYYNIIFGTPKIADMQAWANSNLAITYKVEFLDEILSTGVYNPDSYIEDYYTIVSDENNNKKININGYINTVKLDAVIQKNNIQINCTQKQVYTECEIYKFEILNNSKKTIKLNSGESNQTVYLKCEEEDVNYTAFMHELAEYDLLIEPNKTKNLNIKFNKFYNPSVKTEAIVFEDIILDYEKYENTIQPEKHYTDRMQINIDIK